MMTPQRRQHSNAEFHMGSGTTPSGPYNRVRVERQNEMLKKNRHAVLTMGPDAQKSETQTPEVPQKPEAAPTPDPAPKDEAVTVIMQTGSVDTRNAGRDQHLCSEDFFNIEEYPEIRFTSSASTPTPSATCGPASKGHAGSTGATGA